MTERKCRNWIQTLGHMTTNTESPDNYWLWSGLYTIGSALRRRVWIAYGIDELLVPNLYVILVSPPGRCRKGPPISLAKRFLKEIGMNVSVDSASKQLIASEIAKAQSTIALPELGTQTESSMAIISKEFSSLLSVDPKEMINFLTDIYDYHDVWEYKVLSRDADKLYGPCVSLFAATTPTYMANNVPYETFGTGFFSRIIIGVGLSKRKREPWPGLTEEQVRLFKDLKSDLNIIKNLKGPMVVSEDARETFDAWYSGLDSMYDRIQDERFHGFIERAHIQVLKVAICLSVSRSNELIITQEDMEKSISIIGDIFKGLPIAFGGFGRSQLAQDLSIIMNQLSRCKRITKDQLIADHAMNLTPEEVNIIVRQLLAMKYIRVVYPQVGGEEYVWIKEEE